MPLERGESARFEQRATIAALALVGSSFLFGGQSVEPMFVQSIPQLVAVLVIAFLCVSAPRAPFAPGAKPMLILAGAMLALILIQLLPLPYGIWSVLPGREVAVATLQAARLGTPWHALSEDPGATLQSALTLLPALAMLLTGLMLDRQGLRQVMLAILICAGVSLLIGWLQMLAGTQSALYFYGNQHERLSIGLFSNRNHQADALSLGVLMAGAALYTLSPRVEILRRQGVLIAILVAALFGLGVLSTASRMGAALFIPAAAVTIVIALVDSHAREITPRDLALIALVALLFALLGWAGFDQLLSRFQAPVDLRATIWPDAWYLAKSVWPVGTGFGTFDQAYPPIESLAGVTPLFINAAHQDYLQLAIEGGAPALLTLLAFLGWFVLQVVRLARRPGGMTGWFAATGIFVLLVHSAADYPLRTEALSTALAALCVVLNMAAQQAAPRRSATRKRVLEPVLMTAGYSR
jgi:O-antigen ligase